MTKRELVVALQEYPDECLVVFECYSNLVFPVGATSQGFFTRHDPRRCYGDFEGEPAHSGEVAAIMLWPKEGLDKKGSG